MKNEIRILKPYLLLWSTQTFSALGSGMTAYALVLWLYRRTGSALQTALLSVCTYAPYVLAGIFGGAISDRWNKKRIMLTCDFLAACTTVFLFLLVRADALRPWHLYALNGLNGLMNAVQQPASEVASTLLIPKEYYQKTSALRSFSSSLNAIMTPVLATALFAFAGIGGVMAVDLATFAAAFLALLLFIPIPSAPSEEKKGESLLSAARQGLRWLGRNPLVLTLILFLAAINLLSSMYDAALPAMLLSCPGGGEKVLGAVNACVGVATLAGSLLAMALPAPRNRVKVICAALFVSMGTENFLLAFGKSSLVWCVGAVLGWITVPLMNANLDVILRSAIPPAMQGRIYACRNSLQFFTIPLGLTLGGLLVDRVFEPLMAKASAPLLTMLFGAGKGSGAAMLFAAIGAAGVAVCAVFTRILRKYT